MSIALRALITAVAGALIGAAQAAPINLITNGSFEAGLAGWTHTGSAPTFPVVAITYNTSAPYPTSAFGEAVPPPNDATQSVDAAGVHGAYFVDDAATNEALTQTIFLTAGIYRIGFDAYAPRNGYSNPQDATLSAEIAGATLANLVVSDEPVATWLDFSGVATITTSGFYSASFVFNTPNAGAAKDIVIDRVFVEANIPEPETLALFAVALASAAIARRRRPRK